MAGHSKWANIRRHKEKQDAKKGKIYTKLIRAISVAARHGGDPADNASLRNAIDKALVANMSRDVIDRAIKRGAGGIDGADMLAVRYEGYGPCGIAVLVDCLTNNRNRTVGEVRHVFSKYGGNIGTSGSVAYLFNKLGQLSFAGGEVDTIMEAAISAGAEDIVVHDDQSIDVFTAVDKLSTVRAAMVAAGLLPQASDISMVPANLITIDVPKDAEIVVDLLEQLEELDDVQEVYSNANIIVETL